MIFQGYEYINNNGHFRTEALGLTFPHISKLPADPVKDFSVCSPHQSCL